MGDCDTAISPENILSRKNDEVFVGVMWMPMPVSKCNNCGKEEDVAHKTPKGLDDGTVFQKMLRTLGRYNSHIGH